MPLAASARKPPIAYELRLLRSQLDLPVVPRRCDQMRLTVVSSTPYYGKRTLGEERENAAAYCLIFGVDSRSRAGRQDNMCRNQRLFCTGSFRGLLHQS